MVCCWLLVIIVGCCWLLSLVGGDYWRLLVIIVWLSKYCFSPCEAEESVKVCIDKGCSIIDEDEATAHGASSSAAAPAGEKPTGTLGDKNTCSSVSYVCCDCHQR